MKLRWTQNSITDLHAIYEYIAEDSPTNALQMIDRLTSREEQLMAFPLSGRVVSETERQDIREIIEPPYRIIYHLRADSIDILTVMHGARVLREIPGLEQE